MSDITKVEYQKWTDSYLEHSHKWMVVVYGKYKEVEAVYRYFGPFETNLQARSWASDYTNSEFITSIRILPIYEVL